MTTNPRNYQHGYGSIYPEKRYAEYGIWTNMIYRCHNPNCDAYERYGGRGIEVCPRWRESFENFLSDMGFRPSPDYSLDRIDNDGDYEPGNVQWASSKEQMCNRRGNVKLTYQGKTQALSEWAEEKNLGENTLRARLNYGWDLSDALERPPQRNVRKAYSHSVMIEINGETDYLTGWLRRLNMSDSTVRGRVSRGWSYQDALLTPPKKPSDPRPERRKS